MSYRNIEVNGQAYQYVVGNSNVHIKRVGGKSINIPKDNIGGWLWVDCGTDECSYCPANCPNGTNRWAVKPNDIKHAIVQHRI